jgi:hypothetical protein
MSTIQLIGLAIAIIVLIVLIVTLVVTRGRGGAEAVEPPASTTGSLPTAPAEPTSIFDEKPRDDLAGLGKPAPAPSPAWGAATPSAAGAAMAGAAAASGHSRQDKAEAGQLEVGEVEAGAPPRRRARSPRKRPWSSFGRPTAGTRTGGEAAAWLPSP